MSTALGKPRLIGGKACALSRRGVVAAAATLALPVLLAAPPSRTAQADPAAIAAGLQMVAAISSMTSSQDQGLAEQYAALNVALDTVLDNQIRTLKAVANVQNSIDKLGLSFPAFIRNADYRLLLEDADKLTNDVNDLMRLQAPIEDKVPDYLTQFQTLRDLSSRARSRFATTVTGVEGMGALTRAAPALQLLIETLYAMANIEEQLPADTRWSDNRGSKYVQIKESLQNAMDLLLQKRIPEALQELAHTRVESLTETRSSALWSWFFSKEVLRSQPIDPTEPVEKRTLFKPLKPGTHTIDICLRSNTWRRAQAFMNQGRNHATSPLRPFISVTTRMMQVFVEIDSLVINPYPPTRSPGAPPITGTGGPRFGPPAGLAPWRRMLIRSIQLPPHSDWKTKDYVLELTPANFTPRGHPKKIDCYEPVARDGRFAEFTNFREQLWESEFATFRSAMLRMSQTDLYFAALFRIGHAMKLWTEELDEFDNIIVAHAQ